jgi:hypothetical protein
MARLGGFELTLGGPQVACDQPTGPEQVDHSGHGLVDGIITNARAEVIQVCRERRPWSAWWRSPQKPASSTECSTLAATAKATRLAGS